MSDINVVTLVGRLTEKPVIRYANSGLAITKLSLANNQYRKSTTGEKNEQTNFFNITVMGKQAENCVQFLDKGRQIAVIGRLVQNKWQDKNTGQNRYSVEVLANTIQFLGSRNDSPSSGQQIDNFQNPPAQPEGDTNFSAAPAQEDKPNENVSIANNDFDSPIEDDDVPF